MKHIDTITHGQTEGVQETEICEGLIVANFAIS